MLWFYDQMDVVFAPSTFYREQLIEAGLSPTKVKIMRRGVDTDRFSPAHRDPAFWERFGLERATTLVYVGRVSEEKNVERLLKDFVRLRETHRNVQLAIVGDGPQLVELERRYRRQDVAFTGALRGDDLATAYASADLFVFPSTTDTFGNVVLEAMASGLPAIVTDRGGPQEIVVDEHTGLVVNADTRDGLLNAMKHLSTNAQQRRKMAQAARRSSESARWSEIFDQFWAAMEPATRPDHASLNTDTGVTFDSRRFPMSVTVD
jgi:glycosyltransferase involved in cell wall biosynthesis